MAHRWRFFRAGGFDQVRLDTGADLTSLAELDPKLWVSLSCPTRGLEFDGHTLELLDLDHDGRVRVPEVLAAVKWAGGLLKNPDELARGPAELPLESINAATDEGKQVLASARQILKNLGRPQATTITPADTVDTVKIFAKTVFNGDGIIPAESAEGDEKTAAALKDIMACVGSVKDMSGLDGVDQPRLDQFFKEAQAFVAWWNKGSGDASVLPLKDATGPAWAAYDAVKAKVDDYFARCGLAQMDGRAAAAMNVPDEEYKAITVKELSAGSALLLALPLAKVEAGKSLPLADGLNPAWAAKVRALREQCVKPLLGDRATLSEADWAQVGEKLAGHHAWLATKPAGSVEKLAAARIKELVEGPFKGTIEGLMAKDKALEPEAKAITSVDKLAHYYRDLSNFANNYVAFRDFYTRQGKASFQAGTLYLDGRSCELCLKIDDVGKHSAVAGASMMYLAYCECSRKGSTEKMNIVAAFTAGDSDYLTVGRNGVFYDRKGQDWDATITKVLDQPISVRQAFWSPYKRLAKFISDQIDKFAGEKDKAAHETLTTTAANVAKEAEKKDAFDVAKFAGVFAAIGLALGAIGTAGAALITGFVSLKAWQMPLAVVGAMLLISGPSMLLAAMKLRRRTLGPLLDGSGWAINARAAINIPFGGSLTQEAALPAGSERSFTDPYAQKKTPWGFYLFVLLLLGGSLFLYISGDLQTLVAWVKDHLR